jgi:hypothetical protein
VSMTEPVCASDGAVAILLMTGTSGEADSVISQKNQQTQGWDFALRDLDPGSAAAPSTLGRW